MNPLGLKHCFGLYTIVYIQQQWIRHLKLKQLTLNVDLAQMVVDAPGHNGPQDQESFPYQDIQDQTPGLLPEEEEEEEEEVQVIVGVL